MISALLAAAPTALPPTGPWRVDYAPDICVMSRDFGANANTVTIGFRPTPMGSGTEMLAIWSGEHKTVHDGAATVQLDSASPVTARYARWTLPDNRQMAIIEIADATSIGGLDKASTLSVKLGDSPAWTLSLAAVAKAVAALNTCNDDLLKSWGVDKAESARLSQPPRANPARYFGPDSYPYAALRVGAQGRVIVAVTIGIDGRISDCRVVSSSGNKALDDGTCDVARTIRYTPARDLAGAPTVAHQVIPVRWVLPGG